ncbi:MAG: LysR family transcriptional regulator [Vibrio sp.]
MIRENFNELYAFVIVAQERSFTKAAAKLGITQSALSQTIRGLEDRLDIRLLTRTTRSVSPTEAGEQLMNSLQHHFSAITDDVSELSLFKDIPTGHIRITCGEHALDSALWPKLMPFLEQYPEINVEIQTDNTFIDIVEKRFDAGIRMGDQVEKDMVAVKIGPQLRMAVVAAPSYFERNPIPEHPNDLLKHTCVNLRLPTLGGHLIWDFDKDGKTINVRPQGQLTFNSSAPILRSALRGLGLAYVTEDRVLDYLESGKLVRVLEDWCEPFEGYYLYYPSRKQHLPAFKLMVDALRHKD